MQNFQYDSNEFETAAGEFEYTDESEFEQPFDEVQEMELAADLLEVSDEAELDQFLGNLMRRADQTAGTLLKSPTGRALGGILKGAARKALPHLGRAIGSHFGGPRGGAVGARLASQAGQLFGLELEGLSPEDQEFELARRYVRFAGSAARRAARRQSGSQRNPVRSAVVAAAQHHAPGLIRRAPYQLSLTNTLNHGLWQRRGSTIVLLDA